MADNRFQVTTDYPGGRMLGYVTVSYAHLYALLGESLGGDGYKVSTEWYVKDNQTGRTFNIYDYKATDLYSAHCPTVEEFRAQPEYEWHIGGTTKEGLTELKAWLQSTGNRDYANNEIRLLTILREEMASQIRLRDNYRAQAEDCMKRGAMIDGANLAATASRFEYGRQLVEGLILSVEGDE